LSFVADNCVPVTFYLNSAWAEQDLLRSLGFKPESLTTHDREFLKGLGFKLENVNPNMPKLVYISQRDWEAHTRVDSSLPVNIIKNEFILSSSQATNRLALEQQGFNAATSVLCLAAVGLDLVLPNVSFDLLAQEEISKIRDELEEERVNYLEVITKIADESYERISSPETKDILKWAKSEVTFKLIPKARFLEQGVSKLEKTTLKKAAYSFWKDGVPAIGSAYLDGGVVKASKVSGEALLRFLVAILGDRMEKRSLPEIAYAFKISQKID